MWQRTAGNFELRHKERYWDGFLALTNHIPAGVVSQMWKQCVYTRLVCRIAKIQLCAAVLAGNDINWRNFDRFYRIGVSLVGHSVAYVKRVAQPYQAQGNYQHARGPL